ncbi:AAA family ATPase [Aerosakkonemataceae cyanobacterium BLCC-F50]|uniref:AAA family ATPase n=1 Tax=Floridaenema flaviceps BLCC-F50 TaxID=3153642 RepID=A0ABV4XNA8_9CYAN
MKINELTYCDRELEWRFNPIHFSDLTLLVGISGVGKTQIIKSIIALQEIAKGGSINGLEWDIYFSINNDREYQWKGKFETKKLPAMLSKEDEKSEGLKFRLIWEELYFNNVLIIERSDNKIKFKGDKLPKLSPFQSVVYLFSEEEDVVPIRNAFNKIIYSEGTSLVNPVDSINYIQFVQNYNSLEKIQNSNFYIQIKLALVYIHAREVFQKIKESFINIFSQVEDIQIHIVETEYMPLKSRYYPFVYIKEKGVNHWIPQTHISSGMFRTLMHISELYLCAEGSVILIDEFENSLGVNCIDVLTELLLENRNLQFIITSHHPYIINKISMEHWKIVTRQGGVVTARDAKDFNLGKSRHQAFMQLINLEEYAEGIKV